MLVIFLIPSKRHMKKIIAVGQTMLFMAILLSCKKDPPPQGPETHYLPQEVLDYFPAQTGDTLVYRDSISGQYDTLFCYRGGTLFVQSTYGGELMFTEEAIFHSFFGTHVNYPGIRRYTSRLSLHSDGSKEFYIREGGDRMMRFPIRLGDSLTNGEGLEGYSVIRAFYPTFVVDNQVFHDVYRLYRYAVAMRLHSEYCDYYMAKGKGIVAVREYKTNRLWVLQ
jgi:hypothetical protein